ncbi:Ig-like domain-containing protein [Coprobacter tertius]|uniref:Ig-like domain-containing protein n=1 Tax=Coprobacter tertius TaxID=2944915 RepID=A0ABT1MK27_9BACT|nr:Ig-like domain-containing protein [Coprobacter tertius]MCP9612994.1 Ig-like domain-containing protein [Coprobacter tertius]
MKKKMIKFFKSGDFLFFVFAVVAACVGISGAGVWAAAVIPGSSGGKIVTGEPLTTDISRKESSGLIKNEIDRRITRIRPMSTPIDQLTRWAGSRRAGSMVVDYYSVDVKPTKATLNTAYTEPESSSATSASQKVKLNTTNNDIFEVSETILVQGVKGYEADGTTQSKADLVLYISSKEENGELNVYAINGKKIGSIENCVPSIAKGATFIRMGRAATELDVQTAQFEALPVKEQNNCQIFKMQVEQSTFQKIANKEVEWDFSDAEESAIYDMRLGMEKTFMFGVKRSLYDSKKKENVSLTGGIWWQAGKEYEFDPKVDLTQNDLIDIMKEAFTGNGGNKRKVLIGGSDFIGRINKLEVTKIVTSNEDMVKWGIDFSEIKSKFGRLFVLYSEVFDDCGMSDYGFIFDPEFITKWSHVPFGTQALDLKKAGVRNTDALVLTEASCLTLRYPAAHMRIIPKTA